MNILIDTEEKRLPAAVAFVQKQMEELDREIRSCDYYEDPHGELVYAPGSYVEEKRQLQSERDRWQTMLNILTIKTPATVLDW